MVVLLILVSLTVLSVCHSSLYTSSSVKVYYVKPTSPASAECPSGENVPCHTLQYYADHSNFTSNSEFHFLEGEHLLGSVVSVTNITNLSLIGAGPGVKILCQSVPSGFHIIEFAMLKLENFSAFECRSTAKVTIFLEDGSGATISHVTVSSSRGGGVTYFSGVGHNINCSDHFLKFTGVTLTEIRNNYMLALVFRGQISAKCGVLIKDTAFSNSLNEEMIPITKVVGVTDVAVNVTLFNVTITNLTTLYEPDWAAFSIFHVNAMIINCIFENNFGTALGAFTNSALAFRGINIFRNNVAEFGAALRLKHQSQMSLFHNVTIYFINNHAKIIGGAIAVIYHGSFCSFDYVPMHGIELIFTNNTAIQAGSDVYGGTGQCCSEGRMYQTCEDGRENFLNIFYTSNTEADPSALTSDPYRVCSCEHNRHQPNCSRVPDVINTVPGGVFTLRLAVVDPFYGGAVFGDIRVYFENSSTNATLGTLQSTQANRKAHCSDFTYSVFSTNTHETLSLQVDALLPALIITVHLDNCPLGFALSHDIGKCVCAPVIDRDNVKCFIEDRKILRQGNTWIGFVNTSSHNTDILFNDNCPSGYCLAHPVNVTVTSGDDQCESHRTGILCGQCKEGYSLTLSTQECRKCSNTYLLLIIPLAFLGILLVALLFILNLTVSEGTINGLIFYANVIEMNLILRLPKQQNYLYIFLAWLNLDLGINMCLFDGMDAYTETWLQFVFPFYLWMIILLIIVFYNKFPTVAARLGGGNSVNVLATLLLLSYTKLQQTVVTILSFTSLKYPSSGTVHYVWLYDANVEYFTGKHLYLGITAIAVLVLLIIPYTSCLAFFQHLQAHSQHRIFHWVNKLKPVFDAYARPYKDRSRFWTGMLLIIRTLLIVIFNTGSKDLNLLVILVVSLTLLLASSNGIYRKWIYNYLESLFYLQLGVFAGGIAYSRLGHGSMTVVIDTSTGVSLVVTGVVIGYLVYQRYIKNYVYFLRGYTNLDEERDFSFNYRDQPCKNNKE